MSLHLYSHPLSSFCHKVLIALYENSTAFEHHIVDLMGDASAFKKLWPIGKIPVLRDEARDKTVPETSIIIEYLQQHMPGPVTLIPGDVDPAREVRLQDRFYDLYVQLPMQKCMLDRMRPEGKHDPLGVEEARTLLRIAYGMIDAEMARKTWAAGGDFTMADCAAAPALFYANMCVPFAEWRNVAAYFERLRARPSYARVLKEAEPYFAMIPK
jgi:glutathione S-transferase